MKTNRKQNQKGFTLVELAIVLVIIGLIVGGVLAGQDLIKAAGLRAAQTQFSTYDTSALAFQNKYNALPGDLSNTTANSLWSITTAANTTGAGDQNGSIDGVSAAGTICTNGLCLAGENAVFFTELNKASLIGDAMSQLDPTNYVLTTAQVKTAVPLSKLGSGTYIIPQGMGGVNYYVLLDPTVATLAAGGSTSSSFKQSISPLQASQLDGKLDDGLPGTGRVIAIGGAATTATPAAGSTFVANAAQAAASNNCNTAGAYAITSANGTKPLCALSVRASF